jgi:hypothetical protein
MMVCTRKVWGVLGLLLALVVVVGYGQYGQQPQPPQPPYLIKLRGFPTDLVGVFKAAIEDIDKTSKLGLAATINAAHAAMYVDAPSGIVIAAAPANTIPNQLPKEPQIIGLLYLPPIPIWPPICINRICMFRLNPDGSVSLLDPMGKEAQRIPSTRVKITPSTPELLNVAGPPKVAILPNWENGQIQPQLIKICIGWKKPDCTCIGVYIEF